MLGTSVFSSFIWLSQVLQSILESILELDNVPMVPNEIGKLFPIVGTIKIMVQVRKSTERIKLPAAKWLVTEVILACEFCDVLVEAIKPRFGIVEMDDCSTVCMFLEPSQSNTNVPIPEEQQISNMKNRSLLKIKKPTKRVMLKPENQI